MARGGSRPRSAGELPSGHEREAKGTRPTDDIQHGSALSCIEVSRAVRSHYARRWLVIRVGKPQEEGYDALRALDLEEPDERGVDAVVPVGPRRIGDETPEHVAPRGIDEPTPCLPSTCA